MINFNVKKTTNDIIKAFEIGGINMASDIYAPFAAFREGIIAELSGKIPSIYIERICFKPKRK